MTMRMLVTQFLHAIFNWNHLKLYIICLHLSQHTISFSFNCIYWIRYRKMLFTSGFVTGWLAGLHLVATLFNSRLLTVIFSHTVAVSNKIKTVYPLWVYTYFDILSISNPFILTFVCVNVCVFVWLNTWKHLPNCRGENAHIVISHARQIAINGAKP